MRERTPKDDRALTKFSSKLVARWPGADTKHAAIGLLRWLRTPGALNALTELAADADPKVAKSAARAAEEVRSRIEK